MLNAFDQFKFNYQFEYRLQPLIKIISQSKNVILIRNILNFINLFAERSVLFLNEIYDSCKMESLFEQLISKIKIKEFTLNACDYEKIMLKI